MKNKDALCQTGETKLPRYPTGRTRGAAKGNAHALKHGQTTAAAKETRRDFAALRRQALAARRLIKLLTR